MTGALIAVLGEALIDLAETGDDDPRLARPGGSPYNVAIGLARLGQPVQFVGRLSTDPLGSVLRNHALRSGVDLSQCVATPQPSTVALVELDATGGARYRFGTNGTADFGWTDAELGMLCGDAAAVHFGSLASWLAPGDAAIAAHVKRLRAAGALVSYDPNVRPQLQPDPAAARIRIEAAIRLAHLVKSSADDLAWLYPGRSPEQVVAQWHSLGTEVVVITGGASGATAYFATSATGAMHRDATPITVVDTVGAGDAFTSGLLDALARHDRLSPAALSDAPWADMLDAAGLVAALTCARAGANPPRRAELANRP